MKISCLLHTDELTYISYMKLWDFEGKFSACLRIKEKHRGQKGGKATYLQSAFPSGRLLLVFWYIYMELSVSVQCPDLRVAAWSIPNDGNYQIDDDGEDNKL